MPRSSRRKRYVSRAVKAATAAMIVTPNVSEPTINGTFDPGGATMANTAGIMAVSIVPTFCAIATAETRIRAGNISG